MKILNKIVLGLVIITVTGLLFFAVTTLFAFTSYSAADAAEDELIVMDRYTPIIQSINRISIVTINSNVEITTGDRFHIEVSSGSNETDKRFVYSSIGDTFIASEFSIFSAAKLILSNENIITVYVPESFGGTLVVSTVGANVTVDTNCSFSSISLVTTTGSASITATEVEKLRITTGTGPVDVDTEITTSADIITATGDINIGEVMGAAQNIRIISLSGQVAVEYAQPVRTDIVNLFGDIDITFGVDWWREAIDVVYVAVDDFSEQELNFTGTIRYSLNTISGEVRFID